MTPPISLSPNSTWRQLLREPLLHFVVLGALVFGADHLRARDDPRTIVVGADVDRELRETYRSARGTDAGPAELTALRQRWIDNEVLYREGLALRVDQGDPAIRERVIFKALNVMEANLTLPRIDEAGLRAWFEAHRSTYDEPDRLDFLEAVLVGDASDELVRGFVKALNAGGQSEAKSGLRIFKGRPRANVLDSFGAEFTTALEGLPAKQWAALASKDGLRVVRLEGRAPGTAARFDDIRAKVLQDWKDSTMQNLRTVAVRELGRKYSVRYEERTTP
jgi:PPIC-type PPIASE domain